MHHQYSSTEIKRDPFYFIVSHLYVLNRRATRFCFFKKIKKLKRFVVSPIKHRICSIVLPLPRRALTKTKKMRTVCIRAKKKNIPKLNSMFYNILISGDTRILPRS